MSLLNQMLNDLEQRRAESGSAPTLHREVRPLPAAPRRSPAWIPFALLVVGLIGGGLYGWFRYGPVAPPPVPALLDAVLPPLTVATPPPVAPIGEIAPLSGTALPDAAEHPVATSAGKGPAATLRLSESLSVPRLPGRAPAAMPQAEPQHAVPAAAIPAQAPVQEAVQASADASTGIEKRALEPNPREQAERLYRSALSQLAQGREQDGMATLNAALRSDPEHAAARQLLIKLNIDRRAYEAAGAELEEGLRRLPQQTGWAMLLSRIKLDRGDPEGALAVLERHESHAGSAADYQAAIAAVLQRLNRLSESSARYLRAAQNEPTNGRWWLGLGMVNEASGKAAEARSAYRNAVATGSLSPDLQAYAESRAK